MIVLVRAVAGLVIWAVGFCLLYGIHGLSCANGWPATAIGSLDLHRWALLLAWGAAIAAGTWLVWYERRGGGFAGELARAGAVVGLVATLGTGMPSIVFPACV